MDSMFSSESGHRPGVDRAQTPVPVVTDSAAARAWLYAERANLVAVTAHAAANGRPGHATGLARTLRRYLEVARSHRDNSARSESGNSRAAFDSITELTKKLSYFIHATLEDVVNDVVHGCNRLLVFRIPRT